MRGSARARDPERSGLSHDSAPNATEGGEDDFIAAIRTLVEGESPPARIVLGIGDDAAAWQPSRSHLSVISSDALVDGVHFRWESMPPAKVGHRVLAANLSDLAAMGARPVLATVALGVPPAADRAALLEAYRGMQALASASGTRIVGGDVVQTPALVFAVTVVGEVRRSNLKRRSGGRPGDVVAITGKLGASKAGLECAGRETPLDALLSQTARDAYERPQPQLRAGRWLAASTNVHAMMDISDGLSSDLARLARSSTCGARIDSVPVHEAATAIARAKGEEPLHYALNGGEDYELIVAIAPRAFRHLSARFEQRFGRPLLRVGTLSAEPGLRLVTEGIERSIVPGGWDSLASHPPPTVPARS